MKLFYRGFTLIEIMIASSLSIFLSGALLFVYVNYLENYRYEYAMIARRNNAMNAIDVLRENIKRAGFAGCMNANNLFKGTAIEILKAHDNELGDILRIQYADPLFYLIASVSNYVIQSVGGYSFQKNQNLLVANCQFAEVKKIHELESEGGHRYITFNSSLKNVYKRNDIVSVWKNELYYVKKTKRKNKAGNSIFALYQSNDGGGVEELVEGVEKLKVSQVKQDLWKINLLVGTMESFSNALPEYHFMGRSYVNKSRRYYKEWEIFVKKKV